MSAEASPDPAVPIQPDPAWDPLGPLFDDERRLDDLSAGRCDAADAAAAPADPALALLAALRAEVDAGVAVVGDRRVARDALLLDAVAAGGRVADPGAGLLADLRAHVDSPIAEPAVAPLAVVVAFPPVAPAPTSVPRHHRAARVAVVVATLGAALSTTGVAAAAYGSHPGGAFYTLRAAVFGRTADDPEVPRDLLRRAETELALARSTPAQAADHLAVGEGMVRRARALLPQVRDAAAVTAMDARAGQLSRALQTTPVVATPTHLAAGPRPGAAVVPTPAPSASPPGSPGAVPSPGAEPVPELAPAATATQPHDPGDGGPMHGDRAAQLGSDPAGATSATASPAASASPGETSPAPAGLTPSPAASASPGASANPSGSTPSDSPGASATASPTTRSTPSPSASPTPSVEAGRATPATSAMRPRHVLRSQRPRTPVAALLQALVTPPSDEAAVPGR